MDDTQLSPTSLDDQTDSSGSATKDETFLNRLQQAMPLIAALSRTASQSSVPDDDAHWQGALADTNRIFAATNQEGGGLANTVFDAPSMPADVLNYGTSANAAEMSANNPADAGWHRDPGFVDQHDINDARSWYNPRKYLPDLGGAEQIANEELGKFSRHHNDVGDALRHYEWSRRMSEEIGPVTSYLAGVGHEVVGTLNGQPWNEMMMDLHNNKVGRGAANSGAGIDWSQLKTAPDSVEPTYDSYP